MCPETAEADSTGISGAGDTNNTDYARTLCAIGRKPFKAGQSELIVYSLGRTAPDELPHGSVVSGTANTSVKPNTMNTRPWIGRQTLIAGRSQQ
jgi:hypothetical protein